MSTTLVLAVLMLIYATYTVAKERTLAAIGVFLLAVLLLVVGVAGLR